jgi:hypothetical protein
MTAVAVPALLWRIGHWPDPLAWPPREASLREPGRFDDPRQHYRVLYTAEQRPGCFIEATARFRPSIAALQQAGALLALPARIPANWLASRCIGRLRPEPGQRFLDVRALETLEVLRREFAPLLHGLGIADLDVSGVRGPNRAVTMAISRWAYDAGFQGVAYRSRFDDALDCWAIFEGARVQRIGLTEPLLPDDSDLLAAAGRFGLIV